MAEMRRSRVFILLDDKYGCIWLLLEEGLEGFEELRMWREG